MQFFSLGKRVARLARGLLEQFGLRAAEQLTAGQDSTAVEDREIVRRQALERMAARNWTPPQGAFDREEANERTIRRGFAACREPPARFGHILPRNQ
jgi:antitoxin MazE